MPTRLVTFADGSLRWRLAGRRLEVQAKRSGWFGSVHRWTARQLHKQIPEFARDNPSLDLGKSRGYGYWLWRPYILQKELSCLAPGESLLFLDAGCQLNLMPGTKKRFDEYLGLVHQHGNLVMKIEESLEQWCKRDLLDHFENGVDPGARTLVEPGTIFLGNTESNHTLISEWIRWGQVNNHHYLDDSPSHLPNSPGFKEHRHDQAIFSCLSTMYPIYTLPQETYFPGAWRQRGARYPIWALRNSTPFVLEGTGIVSQTVTRLRDHRHR